jgi:hypothetical protein
VLDICVVQLETLAWGEPSGDVVMAAPRRLLEAIAQDLDDGGRERLTDPVGWNTPETQRVRRQGRLMIRAAEAINGARWAPSRGTKWPPSVGAGGVLTNFGGLERAPDHRRVRARALLGLKRYDPHMTSLQASWQGALHDVLGLVEGSIEASGAFRATGHALASDVQTWLASPEQGLKAGIDSLHGAEATIDALARLAPSGLTVMGAVASEDTCWAEIARRGKGEPETCLAGLTCGAAGQVTRLVWLRAPLVAGREMHGAGAASDGQTPDGRTILERYFADLTSSRFREAATNFTVDTLYSHPPYAGGTERVLFDGREALWRGFVELRGPSPVRQIITGLWQQGERVFVEGVIDGIPNGGSFFATGQISAEGEIARYVAFYSGRRVPRP